MKSALLLPAVTASMLWFCTPAQSQLRALILYDDRAVFQEYRIGVTGALPPDAVVRRIGSFVSFMEYLTDEQWDYVVIVYYGLRSQKEHEALAAALEEHLSRGGTLACTYPYLDDARELWEVLGVASAQDPPEPEDITPAAIWHPTWLGTGGLGIDTPHSLADFGEVITPAPDGRVIGEYEVSGAPVMLETRRGQVIVNGLNWDDWEPAVGMGRAQTRFLTTCIPDFDDSGSLDFFDFLAYQNAFAAGDPRADLTGGGTLTLFDFLAFQNVFAYGCPRQ